MAEPTRPFEAELVRLDSLPGVNRRVAEGLAAEVGVGVKPFADAAHLAAWAGDVSGQQDPRRETLQRQNAPGEPLAETGVG